MALIVVRHLRRVIDCWQIHVVHSLGNDQAMTIHLLDRVSSPLRRPNTLDLLHQPLGNSSIDLSRLLLSHPVRSIDLRFFEVLAQATHVCSKLRILHRLTHRIVRGVDLAAELKSVMLRVLCKGCNSLRIEQGTQERPRSSSSPRCKHGWRRG